jgi:hypothetical protein
VNHHVIVTEIPPEYDTGYSNWAYDTERMVDSLMTYLINLRKESENEDHSIVFYFDGALYKFKLEEVQKRRHDPWDPEY